MADLSPQASDDGSHGFLAGRTLAQQSAIQREFEQLLNQAPKAPAPGPQAGPPDATTAPAVPAPPAGMPLGQRLINAPFTTLAHGAEAVAGDVGRGIIDAPRQIAGGALDFVNNLWNFADTVVKKGEAAGLPNVYFRLFDENGKWAPGIESETSFRKAQEEGKEHILQVPTTGGADTVTGNIIRAAVPFLLGRGTSGSAVGQLPNIARDVISGTVATAPEQQRLSNIIESVAPNFLTRFLEAKPGDEDSLLGHLKAGLEYGGYGALVGGAVKSVQALKTMFGGGEAGSAPAAEGAAAAAPTTPTAEAAGPLPNAQAPTEAAPTSAPPATEAAAAPAAPARDILRIGDPLAPAVQIQPTAREAAMAEVTAGRMAGEGQPVNVPGAPESEPTIMSAETIHDYLAGARVDNPVQINLERIGSPEDIKDALTQVSRTIPQGAVQSNESTIWLSDALGMSPSDLLAGYKGEQLNASETTAMRFMLDSSASQLVKYAEAARDPLATPEVKAQFLKAFTTHRALQAYAENARAEAGRTLQAWSIMSQQRSNYAQAVSDLISHAEGTEGDLSGLAEKIATLNPLQAGRAVAGSMAPRDRLLTGWYNALLSSPTTVVKKAMSDIGMATWNVATTALAEKFGANVPEGETANLLAGYAGAFKDAVRAGGKALMAGESQFYKDFGTWEGTPIGNPADVAMQRFRIANALNGAPEALDAEQPSRSAFEYIRTLLPTSWIAGVDDFAKVWNYRAELRRLAWRASDGDSETFARTMDAPPASLNAQAVNAALKTTFQEPLAPGTFGSALRTIADQSVQIPHTSFDLPLGRMLLPFVKVPVNIAKTAAENSPIGFFMRPVQAALRSGGPQRDIALAKIGLGSGVSLGLADLALNNYITGRGPSDPSLRREWIAAGHQPYSLQLPGMRPLSLNQIEPFGLTLGAIADTFNILKFSEDEKDFGTLLPSLALGIGNAMLSKTYYEGISNLFEAIDHPEGFQGSRFGQNLVQSFAEPQLVQRVARGLDQWERAHYGYLDTLEAGLPFLRNNLPPQRTLWGDPVPIQEAFAPLLPPAVARMVSPLREGPDPKTAQPIDKWIWDNREYFPLQASGDPRGIQKMSRTQVWSAGGGASLAVVLNPVLYDRLQALAGNEIKNSYGLGLKDTLNAMVEGHGPPPLQRSWDTATQPEKVMIVTDMVNQYRKLARQQLVQESPVLASTVTEGLKARAQALTGRPQ